MQTKPTNWDTILAGQHIVETVATIDGVEYSADKLISIKTRGALYDKMSIGNATSRKLELEYIPTSEASRQATVSLKTRLTKGKDGNRGMVTFSGKGLSEGVTVRYSLPNGKCIVYSVAAGTDLNYYTYTFETSDKEPYDVGTIVLGTRVQYVDGEPYRRQSRQTTIYNSSDYAELPEAADALGSNISYSNMTLYIPKGTFFISTRERTDYGTTKLTCYDSMLKCEAEYPHWSDNFPKTPSTVLSEIATEISVSLDSRNVIDNTITVPTPIEDNGVLTMRELLQRIGVAQAGNFVMNDAGQLRLIPLNSIPPETYYLTDENANVLVWEDSTKLVVGGVDNA